MTVWTSRTSIAGLIYNAKHVLKTRYVLFTSSTTATNGKRFRSIVHHVLALILALVLVIVLVPADMIIHDRIVNTLYIKICK